MKKIEFSADKLVKRLLGLPEKFQVSILDSCGVNYLDSKYLIAGIEPRETFCLSDENPQNTLDFLDKKLSDKNYFNIFTISYDFGLKLENLKPREKEFQTIAEPDVYLAVYDVLIFHDYNSNETFLIGNEKKFEDILSELEKSSLNFANLTDEKSTVLSNFSKKEYLRTIETIQEHIRRGDTYQTNLTQQFRAKLPNSITAEKIFWRLRKDNPAPFAAFIRREKDTVVSTSPERFFRIEKNNIQTSPIKGTRPRGKNPSEDEKLKNELLTSAKDRAENTMIVDLLRNDFGRVCKFGSVAVEKLCDLETHPTFFHLVSTVSGQLKTDVKFSEILKAVFPCGSITGAPKIRTMQIIDQLETANHGLSMGAVGFSIQNSKIKIQNSIDLNVAIRTMIVKNQEAIFNVGGGILIDSIPENEYEEMLIKAKAIFRAINADVNDLPK
ncbi:MAG: aminodeoxychorismate synthase component I [Pyrinomonadaceae bacterium]